MGLGYSCGGCDPGCDPACGRWTPAGKSLSMQRAPLEHEAGDFVTDENAESTENFSEQPSPKAAPNQAAPDQAAPDRAAPNKAEPQLFKPLLLTVVSARNLRNADWSVNPFKRNLSDPYCICSIEGKPLSRSVTEVVYDNLDPTWNQEIQFGDFEAGDSLSFQIFDKDINTFKKDDFLGFASLPSCKFQANGYEGELLLSEAGTGRKAYLSVKVQAPVQFFPPATVAGRSAGHENGDAKPVPKPVVKPAATKVKIPVEANINPYKPLSTKSGNSNDPSAYVWLEGSLKRLAANEATSLACIGDKKQRVVPILFFFGGCPNALCGMQAVMFAVAAANVVEFWWVKPSKENPKEIEQQTLCLNESGKHKNSPGRSGAFYQPLADLFQQGCKVKKWTFGLKKVLHNGVETDRAVIYKDKDVNVLYVTSLWQEDFTMNPFARSKYIKGKVIYQKSFTTGDFFSRQYEIHDGAAYIADFEEGPVHTVLPTTAIKSLWDMGVP